MQARKKRPGDDLCGVLVADRGHGSTRGTHGSVGQVNDTLVAPVDVERPNIRVNGTLDGRADERTNSVDRGCEIREPVRHLISYQKRASRAVTESLYACVAYWLCDSATRAGRIGPYMALIWAGVSPLGRFSAPWSGPGPALAPAVTGSFGLVVG